MKIVKEQSFPSKQVGLTGLVPVELDGMMVLRLIRVILLPPEWILSDSPTSPLLLIRSDSRILDFLLVDIVIENTRKVKENISDKGLAPKFVANSLGLSTGINPA